MIYVLREAFCACKSVQPSLKQRLVLLTGTYLLECLEDSEGFVLVYCVYCMLCFVS